MFTRMSYTIDAFLDALAAEGVPEPQCAAILEAVQERESLTRAEALKTMKEGELHAEVRFAVYQRLGAGVAVAAPPPADMAVSFQAKARSAATVKAGLSPPHDPVSNLAPLPFLPVPGSAYPSLPT